MLISLNSIANENKFEVSNIELENSGKIIIANNGKYTSKDRKFEVVANKFIYNKEESLLSIFEGEAINKFDGLKIKFDKSIYSENNLTLSSKGDITIEDKNKNKPSINLLWKLSKGKAEAIKILDLEIEGISLIRSHKSETMSILRKNKADFNDLIEKLKIKK